MLLLTHILNLFSENINLVTGEWCLINFLHYIYNKLLKLWIYFLSFVLKVVMESEFSQVGSKHEKVNIQIIRRVFNIYYIYIKYCIIFHRKIFKLTIHILMTHICIINKIVKNIFETRDASCMHHLNPIITIFAIYVVV